MQEARERAEILSLMESAWEYEAIHPRYILDAARERNRTVGRAKLVRYMRSFGNVCKNTCDSWVREIYRVGNVAG